MFSNLFHITKTNPFVHRKVPVPALNQEFFDKVTEVLYHSPESIQAATQRTLFLENRTWNKEVEGGNNQLRPRNRPKSQLLLLHPLPLQLLALALLLLLYPIQCTVRVDHTASLMASQWPQGASPPPVAILLTGSRALVNILWQSALLSLLPSDYSMT